MFHFVRVATFIAAPLAAAVLLACVSPAGARILANRTSSNGITPNGIWDNGISPAGRITTGSALGDLNGVVVETAVLPDAALR